MLKSKGLFAAVLIAALVPVFFLPTVSGQEKGGGRGGKQKAAEVRRRRCPPSCGTISP